LRLSQVEHAKNMTQHCEPSTAAAAVSIGFIVAEVKTDCPHLQQLLGHSLGAAA
jgi:hypothetical protein